MKSKSKRKSIPLWQTLACDPRAADFGATSASFDTLSLWLKEHPTYATIKVRYEAPVNWRSVLKALARIKVSADDPMLPVLEHCRNRLRLYLA